MNEDSEQLKTEVGNISQPEPGALFNSGSPNAEAIKSVSQQVAAKHSGNGPETAPKRKRGRPAGSRNAPHPEPVPQVPPPPPVDPQLIVKSVQSVCVILDGVICRKIGRLAFQVTGDKGISEQMVSESALTKEESDLIANLSGVICMKYNLLGQYAPELMLMVSLSGYVIRVSLTLKRLKELAISLKAKNATLPQVVQAPDNGEKRNG